MGFIWYIIIGIIAGFLAGKIMRGGGFGLIINFVTWYSRRSAGRLGICLFGLAASGIDWKFDNFYRRSYSGIMDCFFILEI